MRASKTYKRTKSSAIRHAPPVNTVGQHVIAPTRNYDGDSRSSTYRYFFGKRRQNKRTNLSRNPQDAHTRNQTCSSINATWRFRFNAETQRQHAKCHTDESRPRTPNKTEAVWKQEFQDVQTNEAMCHDILHPSFWWCSNRNATTRKWPNDSSDRRNPKSLISETRQTPMSETCLEASNVSHAKNTETMCMVCLHQRNSIRRSKSSHPYESPCGDRPIAIIEWRKP